MFLAFLNQILISLSFALPTPHSSVKVESLLGQGQDFAFNQLASNKELARVQLPEIAFSEQASLNTRWQAMMVLARLERDGALPTFKKASLSSNWFLRSASLTAVYSFSPNLGNRWSQKMFVEDPALMVRMKALEIIGKNLNNENLNVLWSQLDNTRNFHRGRSLWIRQDILQHLSQKPRGEDLSKWVRVLHQENPTMQKIAVRTIARLAGDGGAESDLAYWQNKFPLKQYSL